MTHPSEAIAREADFIRRRIMSMKDMKGVSGADHSRIIQAYAIMSDVYDANMERIGYHPQPANVVQMPRVRRTEHELCLGPDTDDAA